MTLGGRIESNPEILAGKPVIRGTRLAVEFILGLLADGWAYDEILSNYPGLEIEDIHACLEYANDVINAERPYPEGT